MKYLIAHALLRLYPRAWQREYGPELLDILLRQPLTAGIVANVLLNGLRQRVLVTEPSTLLGLVLMPGAAYALLYQQRIVSLQTSNLYVLILIGCGVWTHLRYGGELSRSGRAAVKLSCIAGLPAMQAGLMMLAGILKFHPVQDVCWIRVSDASGLIRQIQTAMCPPSPLGVLVAPLFILPASWLWGTLGGFLGRWIARAGETPSIVK
jgi:hypothetical protein